MGWRRALTCFGPATVVVAGLSACIESTSPRHYRIRPPQINPPVSAPILREDPAPAPMIPDTPKSAASRAYFADIQRRLMANGLMRRDKGSVDAPFNERHLAENFMQIALRDEYHRKNNSFVHGDRASILRRWERPIWVWLEFGNTVPPKQKTQDQAWIAAYLARLSDITNHPIALAPSLSQSNFTIFIVSEDEREALGPKLHQTMPGLTASDIQDVTQMTRETYCLVFASSTGKTGVYTNALAVVRSEFPDLMRQSCYHEEIAQGLGLANDYPHARPSIFNDDEEFALLTPMDELLLKILYDQQLRPGMTPAQAQPIVYSLATRLVGGES